MAAVATGPPQSHRTREWRWWFGAGPGQQVRVSAEDTDPLPVWPLAWSPSSSSDPKVMKGGHEFASSAPCRKTHFFFATVLQIMGFPTEKEEEVGVVGTIEEKET